jgi:nitroreductase
MPQDHLKTLLEQRWSCRAFQPDEVPGQVIREMFETAQRTASWCNTQPWHVYLTSGAATKRFAESLTAEARDAEQSPDFDMPGEYCGIYKQRRREAGYALYASLGIAHEDWDARAAQRLKNFEFFGAPHVAVITTDRDQGVYGAIDCGGYVANLLLAAQSLGVAAIPQAAIAMYSRPVRQFFDIPGDRLVVCAVSFGYPDLDNPVNQFRTSRADSAGAVTMMSD